MRLILASQSPRRAEILRDAGFMFETLPVNVDEAPRKKETPPAHVERLAREKAIGAAAKVGGRAVIIGADTVVVVGRRILGKPGSRADARRMLRMLSGRVHHVLTGLAVLRLDSHGRSLHSAVETTRVRFARLSEREIDEYVATGEPDDKAGAYAVQGRAGRFVTRIDGCYFNVVGLPLNRVCRILEELGWRPKF